MSPNDRRALRRPFGFPRSIKRNFHRVPPLLRIARCVPPFSCTFPVVLQLKGFEKKDSRDSWPFSKTMVILIIDVDAAK